MKIRNLDTNIVYRVCEELTRRNQCGPLEVDFIYRTFADLPDEEIAANIRTLVERGWLQESENRLFLYLTDLGQAEIRAAIPDALLPTCEKPPHCDNR